MADREKVLKGLEAHATASGCMKNCPYWGIETSNCSQELAADALALLKVQQPRVLTVGEIRSLSGCPVWRETKNSLQKIYQGWVLLYEIQKGKGITGERFGMAEPNGRVSWFKTDDYSKTWRCWSSRPMDEERKAVAWSE